MRRTLQPELLDSLSPTHPDALHNRRDLRLTNVILGTHRWIARTVPARLRPGERALELGAGTGELGRRLIRRGVRLDGLDRWPRPKDWPEARGWHQTDLLTFPHYADYAAVVGNLIFHQFHEDELAALGARLRGTMRVLIAAEPVRRRSSQWLYRFFGHMLGANPVSLHDAHVSIAAGFRGAELPHGLGLDPADWQIESRHTLLGVHRLTAVRR